MLTASDWPRTSELLFCSFLETSNLPRIPRGVLVGVVEVFFPLNAEFAIASDFSMRGDLTLPVACDSVAVGDFLATILLPIRDHLVVPALLFVPTLDRSASTEVFVLLLPSILPIDDLIRVVDKPTPAND
jgi:hypothetical protein